MKLFNVFKLKWERDGFALKVPGFDVMKFTSPQFVHQLSIQEMIELLRLLISEQAKFFLIHYLLQQLSGLYQLVYS